jgi:hypothetical protein
MTAVGWERRDPIGYLTLQRPDYHATVPASADGFHAWLDRAR